jgi:hypothetical protein
VIICTVCSKSKDSRSGLIPAEERYKGTHVSSIRDLADSTHFPFYVLSSVYGLIPGDTPVPAYDRLLNEADVEALAGKIEKQIRKDRIAEISFYTKTKLSWLPYQRAIGIACTRARVELEVYELDDDA